MKRILLTILISLFSLYAISAEKTIDASSNEKLQDSFFSILTSLDDYRQQKFASSMATIGVVLSQKYGEQEAHNEYIKLVNGKTANQIIELAKSMSPQIKGMSEKIDGSSMEAFNKSTGQMLIGLPLDRQRAFSSALAKIIYDAEKKKLKKEDMAKSLNGMSAKDVIEYAKTIDAPFPSDDNTEFTISPMTKEEMKKHNLPIKEEKIPLTQSLVPRAE